MITPNQLFRSTINHFIIWWVLVCYKGGTKILCKTAIIHLYKNGINFLWQKASLYFPKKIAVENKYNLKIRLYTYIYIYIFLKFSFVLWHPAKKKKKITLLTRRPEFSWPCAICVYLSSQSQAKISQQDILSSPS